MVLCPFPSYPLETNDDLLLLCDLGPRPRLLCLQLHKVEHDYAVKTRGKASAKSATCTTITTINLCNVCKCLLL